MFASVWTRIRSKKHPLPRRNYTRRPWVEQLEDRTLLSGMTFTDADLTRLQLPSNHSSASGYLATGSEFQLYRVDLNGGDIVSVSADAQTIGSALDSYLRVFDSTKKELFINDNFNATDAALTFQAAGTGAQSYYIGISASGNTNYSGVTGAATSSGASHGLFTLNVRRQTGIASVPDLVGASLCVPPAEG